MRWAQKCAGTRSQPGSTDLRREQETVRRKQPTTPILPAPPRPRPRAIPGSPGQLAEPGPDSDLSPHKSPDHDTHPARARVPEVAAAISRRLRAGTPASILLLPWARLSIRISRCPALFPGLHQSRLLAAGSLSLCLAPILPSRARLRVLQEKVSPGVEGMRARRLRGR